MSSLLKWSQHHPLQLWVARLSSKLCHYTWMPENRFYQERLRRIKCWEPQTFVCPSSLDHLPHSAVHLYFRGLPFVTNVPVEALPVALDIITNYQIKPSFSFLNHIPACLCNSTLLPDWLSLLSPITRFLFMFWVQWEVLCTPKLASCTACLASCKTVWTILGLWGDGPWKSSNSPCPFNLHSNIPREAAS